MTTVKRRTNPSKKATKRVSLKPKNRSKKHTKRNKAKRTRRSRRGGVGERDAAKKAVASMRARPTYKGEMFKARVKNASNCHNIVLKKEYLISIGYDEYANTPAIMSVVRSLSSISNEQLVNMDKNEIDMKYNAWRLREADRRKELRDLKRQGIPSVRTPKPKLKFKSSDRTRDRGVPLVPGTSRTIQIKSNQESAAAHEAALAMLDLDKEIEEEIDADAMREMQECKLEDSQDVDYTDHAPTITEDTLPHGFTPLKVKPADEESIKTKPKILFGGPTRWTPNKNDNINDWSLHSTRAADEEDQFMQLMEMGDNMDIGTPPNTNSP